MKSNLNGSFLSKYQRPARMLVWLALAAFSVWLHLRLIHNVADDAYIHIRIAQHLAQTGQPFYNPGQPVLASSSILWTLVLGVIFLVFPAVPQTLAVVNGILLVGCGWVFLALCRKCLEGRKFSQLIPIGFAVCAAVLLFTASIELMETPLAMLLLGLTALFYLQQKPVWPFLIGCLPFIRMEFALFAGILLLLAWLLKQEKVLPSLWRVAAAAAPFAIYEMIVFGTVIPNTVLAKSLVYDVSIWQKTFETIATLVSLPLPLRMTVYIGLPVTLFILVIQIRQMAQDARTHDIYTQDGRRSLLIRNVLCLFAWAVMGFYIAGRSEKFDWYLPLYTVPFLFGLVQQSVHNRSYIAILLIPLLLFQPISFTTRAIARAVVDPQPPTLTVAAARVRSYIQVGQWLHEQYPDATLLSSEIGGLGYGFEGRVIDGAGLISPDALAFHPMKVPEERLNGTIGAIPLGYIEQTRPELIVSYDFFIKQFLESDYGKDYVRLEIPPADLNDREQFKAYTWFQTLNVFIRRDIYKP